MRTRIDVGMDRAIKCDREAWNLNRWLATRDGEFHRAATFGKVAATANYAFCCSHAVNSVTVLTVAIDVLVDNNSIEWAP